MRNRNLAQENGRRERQMGRGWLGLGVWLRAENCGVPVTAKTGDGRDAAYRLPVVTRAKRG